MLVKNVARLKMAVRIGVLLRINKFEPCILHGKPAPDCFAGRVFDGCHAVGKILQALVPLSPPDKGCDQCGQDNKDYRHGKCVIVDEIHNRPIPKRVVLFTVEHN